MFNRTGVKNEMTVYICERSNKLQHHGIKGQKWGVRRFQNKDGSLTPAGKKRYADDIVIEKGTIQRHISGQKNLSLNESETYLYDPKNKHDKKVYEGAYAMYIKRGKGYADNYIHEYKTMSEIRMPSNKRSVDIFIESYKKDPARYVGEMNYMKDYYRQVSKQVNLSGANKKIASYDKDFDKNTSESDLREYGYATLNSLSTYGSRGSRAINAFYESVKDKGYNALVDDNNRSIYNDAVQPILVFNGNKTLKEIGVTKLSDEDMYKNLDDLEDYMEKKYKGKRHVAL